MRVYEEFDSCNARKFDGKGTCGFIELEYDLLN